MPAFIDRLMGASVRRKLTLGFGTVQLLGVIVTVIALHSLQQLTQRSEALIDSVSLDTQIAAVRLQENEFDRTGKTDAAQAYTTQMQRLTARVGELGASLGANALEPVKQIQAISQRYAQTFAQFVAARHQAQAAELAMAPVIDQIADNLNTLNDSIFTRLHNGAPQQVQQLKANVELQGLIYLLRDQVHVYIADPTPENGKQVSRTADMIRLKGNDLFAQLDSDELQAPLLEALQAVVVYQDRIEDFRVSVDNSQIARQTMLAQAAELQHLSATIYQLQLQGRYRDVHIANLELWLAEAAALLLGLLAAWVMTRLIVPPLKRTLALARQIAAGDLTGNLDAQRRDELGQMMGAMRDMAGQLRQLIGRIGDGTRQLTSSAAELSTVTAQGSEGAARQRQQTEQVALSMKEMVASAQHVAHNALQASEAAHSAEKLSTDGYRMVSENIQRFEGLALNIERSGLAMARLREHSERIDGVLGVIRDVAGQTNLLALNAAIEAARAGEAGRGFAVVADQVRSLAQRTQQSTREIEDLIATLHSGTEEASCLMQESEAMSLSSVTLARQAGDVLKDIRQSAASILAMNAQIATASAQQTQISEQVSHNLQRVRGIADESADSSLQTASASRELSRLGLDLERLVAHFKIQV